MLRLFLAVTVCGCVGTCALWRRRGGGEMGKRLRRMFGGAALFSAMMACLLFLHSHLSPGPPPGMSSERMAEVAAVEAGCVFTCISVCHQDPPAFPVSEYIALSVSHPSFCSVAGVCTQYSQLQWGGGAEGGATRGGGRGHTAPVVPCGGLHSGRPPAALGLPPAARREPASQTASLGVRGVLSRLRIAPSAE